MQQVFYMVQKKVGVLEYHDEKYILDVMDIVRKKTGAEVSFIGLRDYDFSDFSQYSVIFDMISPFNKYIAEIMKVYYLNGTYVINNPFATSTYNKIMQAYKLVEMNMPAPKTVVLPNTPDDSESDFIVKPFFKDIVKKFKFPIIMKPYDGFANQGVYAVNSYKEIEKIWEENKNRIMLVQEAIVPVDYYRVFTINKKHMYFLKREPRFVEAKKYSYKDYTLLTPSLRKYIEKKTIEINKEMSYDLSTIEWSITKDKKAFVIDVNDAPNIADAEKAKKMDLFFPAEAYDFIVKHLSEMIIEKVNMDPHKRDIQMSEDFATTIKSIVKGLKYNLHENLKLRHG